MKRMRELGSCVKVEEAVLGSPSLTQLAHGHSLGYGHQRLYTELSSTVFVGAVYALSRIVIVCFN